jgi:hypothetical protein
MAIKNIQIDNIYNGQSPSYLIGGDYLSSIAIDPDANVSPIINKISGAISPTSHEQFLLLDGNPLWIKPNPKNDVTFTYTDTGKIYRYDKNFEPVGSTLTLSNSSGNGLSYYNGYYYAFKDTNIDRISVDGAVEQNYLNTIKSRFDVYNPKSINSFSEVSIGGSTNTTKTEIAFRFGDVDQVKFVNKIYFLAKRNNNNSSSKINISLVADDTNTPTGTVLSQIATINYANISTDWSMISLDVFFQLLDASGPFWIKIEPETVFENDDEVFFRVVDGSEFPEGLLKDYNGSVWLNVSTFKGLQFILTYEKKLLPEMGNETYPLNGNIQLPNHTAVVHNDTLYYADFIDNRGIIESIKTLTEMEIEFVGGFMTLNQVITGATSGASATIVLIEDYFTSTQPATQSGSNITTRVGLINIVGEFIVGEFVGTIDQFGNFSLGQGFKSGKVVSITQGKMYDRRATGRLELPYGMHPVAIESFGSDIAVLAVQTTDDTVNQGESRIYLWDRFDVSFYREIKLPYATATALLSHNGIPYLWGGDDKGYSFAYYAGGDQVQEIFYIDDGKPPFAGAVVGENNRILWGSNITYPETAGVVHAWGSRNASLPKGLHTIARTPNNQQVTALTVGTLNEQNIIIGSDDMLAKDGGELHAVWRSKVINVGKNFTIKQITLPLSDTVDEDTEITVSVFVDNESRSKEVITIDNTTYDKNKVVIYPDFTGENNFFVELKWSNTKRVSILLPITIKVEVMEE